MIEKKLSQELPIDVEVINAGFKGYSAISHYVYVRRYGLALKPDLILLGVLPDNDLIDLSLHRIKSTDEDGKPTKVFDKYRAIHGMRVSRYFSMAWFTLPVLKHSQLYFFLVTRVFDTLLERMHQKNPGMLDDIDSQLREWHKHINWIEEECERHSVKLAVVILGCRDVLNRKNEVQYHNMGYRLELSSIPTIDTVKDLRDMTAAQACFPHDGHLSARGLDRTAEVIVRALVDNRILPHSDE
jgi:hypothetical protein